MRTISELFNFDNIGGKIKKLSKWFCWITILLIWILVPIFLVILLFNDGMSPLFWILLISAFVIPIFLWIGSWGTYAFGQIVEDVHRMNNNLVEDNDEETNIDATEECLLPQKECPQCGDRHDYDYPKCPKCKYNYNMK